MGSASILDFERLWSPIAADNPCGADLRWDLTYRQIRKPGPRMIVMRSGSATRSLQIGVTSSTSTVDALATKSKDFMIACWLTEALTHVHGFAGVRDETEAHRRSGRAILGYDVSHARRKQLGTALRRSFS